MVSFSESQNSGSPGCRMPVDDCVTWALALAYRIDPLITLDFVIYAFHLSVACLNRANPEQ